MQLRKLRVQHGLTQQELADKLGITKAGVSAYEQDKITPSFTRIIELANMFGVTTDYLMGVGADSGFDDDQIESENSARLGGRLMGIGKQIRKLREENGMTQGELASLLGLTGVVVSKYERDMMAPAYDTLIDMANLFKVSTEKMFGIDTGATIDISALTAENKRIVKEVVRQMR